MAEGREFVLTLKANDLASGAIKKLSEGMGATTGAAKKLAQAGAKTFSAIGGAIVVANQAVQLFKTGFDAISGLVGGSLEAVRELRGETNPLVLEMNNLATESQAAKAALGSAFASALLGISKAFKSSSVNAAEFLDNNRKLIATKIVQFLFKAANALVDGISEGLQLANTTWHTLTATVNESIMAVTQFIGAWSEAMLAFEPFEEKQKMLNARIDEMATLYNEAETRLNANTDAQGKFADQIESVRSKIKDLIEQGYGPALAAAKAFSDAAGATPLESTEQALLRIGMHANTLRFALADGAKQIANGLGLVEGTIAFDKFQTKLDEVNGLIGVATPNSLAALKQNVEGLYAELGTPLVIDVDLNNLDQSREAFALYTAQLDIAVKKAREGFTSLNDEIDNNKTKIEEASAAGVEMANIVSGAIGSSMLALAEGQATLAEASLDALSMVLSAVIQVALNSIIASALTGQANAIAENLGIPVIGLAIGVAAGLAAFAAISALKSSLPEPKKFAQGGFVTGGTVGVDSVPALLQPGEFVLTKDQTDQMLQGGLGGVNIQLTSQIPPSRAEMKKFVRQNVLPALRDLRAQGIT
tara:strand:+ start:614 stop:2383 length:1770 start_codon:yes stop_codon:yes gene_type:complete